MKKSKFLYEKIKNTKENKRKVVLSGLVDREVLNLQKL